MKRVLAAAAVALALAVAGCGDNDGGDHSSPADQGPGIVQRSENVLKAAGYWTEYGMTGVEEVGSGGVFVYTALDPGIDLEANDVCNILSTSFKELVLIRVYDQDGDEIEAESCGNLVF